MVVMTWLHHFTSLSYKYIAIH